MKILSRLRWYGLCVLMSIACASAATLSGPAADLAKAIAAASGPGTITLSVVNSSSLPKDQVTEIQHAIEAELRTAGVRVGSAASANSEVRVTLSENLQGYLWVAEVKQGSETQISMVAVARAGAPVVASAGPSVTVRKPLMWSQPSQILDMILLEPSSPSPRMFVLDADAITSYVIAGGKWQRDQQWPITHTRTFPRDLRGLLVANQNHSVDAYLPGSVCSINGGATSAISCHDGDDAWKIGPKSAFFNSGRNYFTGALVPESEKQIAPFYTMTWLERPGYSLAVYSGVDGRVRMSDSVNERTLMQASTSDWGSDLAAIKGGCGTSAELLVASAGDDTSTDTLRAYEIPDRDPVLVSAAADFPGPITSLWSHDATSATAIAHNLRTGQYEAYSVSITCNQ